MMINLVFSILLTGFGSIGLFSSICDLIRAWLSQRWPTGEAVIISIAVHERRGARGRRRFEPTIDFRYSFEGREYHGHRIAFGDVSSGDRSEADEIADRFRPGTAWVVSICRRRPDLAVLHPGLYGRLWFTFCFFMVYTIGSVTFFIGSVRRLFG
jgi:hypothetical protein